MVTNGNGNGYINRTRYGIAKIAIALIFGLSICGIVIGVILQDVMTIIGSSITAGITGIGTVAGVYIGGDSYRPSEYHQPTNDTVIINQGNRNQDNTYPLTSEEELPLKTYIES